MSNDPWSDDETLLAAGRRALRELPDAPSAAIRRAQAIGRGAPGVLDRIQAWLKIDSWATPLPAMRSGGAEQRQLLFSADARDIDLRLTRADSGWALDGQVLGPCDSASLCVQRVGAAPHWVTLDELGAFHLNDLADGSYDVILYVDTDRVEFAQIDLGPRVGG